MILPSKAEEDRPFKITPPVNSAITNYLPLTKSYMLY